MHIESLALEDPSTEYRLLLYVLLTVSGLSGYQLIIWGHPSFGLLRCVPIAN